MDISDWRKKIDELDVEIVRLINQRAEAARAIGEIKRASDLPVYEPKREQEVFDRVRTANRGRCLMRSCCMCMSGLST